MSARTGKKLKQPTKADRQAAVVAAMPTRERLAQAPVAIVAERDPDGWPVTHCRSIDTVGRLIRAGLVDIDHGDAATRFRRDFHRARFEPLGAADLRRQRGAGGHHEILDDVEDARQRIWDALNHLGGLSAPAGAIIWHVIGMEMTLRDWSLRQIWGSGRTIRQEVATGVLIAALGVLSGYYGIHRKRNRAVAR